MAKNLVFLDADVLISSLYSSKGASYEIVRNPKIKKITSIAVQEEVLGVIERKFKINTKKTKLGFKNCPIKSLGINKQEILKKYSGYVVHQMDSHVIAGAHILRANFLLTFNTKLFLVDKIKNNLGIIVLEPGFFLQYLRSRRGS